MPTVLEHVTRALKLPTGETVQVLAGTGQRVNATATSSSTTEAALPTGARVISLTALDAIAIRFGNTGMGAAAVDADSILFAAGEKPIFIPLNADGTPVTHFRCIRIGSSDVPVQIEKLA